MAILEGEQGLMQFHRTFEIRDQSLETGPQWEATVGPESPWLTLSSYAGIGPSQAEAIVDISGLEPGQYTGMVTVTAEGASNSPAQVYVDLILLWGGEGGRMRAPAASLPRVKPVRKGGRQ